jgi:hypothetical protein
MGGVQSERHLRFHSHKKFFSREIGRNAAILAEQGDPGLIWYMNPLRTCAATADIFHGTTHSFSVEWGIQREEATPGGVKTKEEGLGQFGVDCACLAGFPSVSFCICAISLLTRSCALAMIFWNIPDAACMPSVVIAGISLRTFCPVGLE